MFIPGGPQGGARSCVGVGRAQGRPSRAAGAGRWSVPARHWRGPAASRPLSSGSFPVTPECGDVRRETPSLGAPRLSVARPRGRAGPLLGFLPRRVPWKLCFRPAGPCLQVLVCRPSVSRAGWGGTREAEPQLPAKGHGRGRLPGPRVRLPRGARSRTVQWCSGSRGGSASLSAPRSRAAKAVREL